MKAKLYHDTRKRFRDCCDAWSMYFPYPKWMRRKYNAYGTYLGCRPEEDGMTRCTWEIDEYIPGKGRPYLGRRAKLTDTPKVFQKLFKKYEKLWNNAIAKNTEKAWEKWNLA